MSSAISLWRPPPASHVALPDGGVARPWDASGEYVDLWPMRVPHPDAWKWTREWRERRVRRAMGLDRLTRVLLLFFFAALLAFEWFFLVSVCCAFALRFA